MRQTAYATCMLLACAAMAGCLQPHRVQVPEAVLDASPVAWVEEELPRESDGWLGPRSTETRYQWDPPNTDPPFPGIVQVFSVRRLDPLSIDQSLQRAEDAVAAALEREGIDPVDPPRRGERTLDSGVQTKWFVQAGHVASPGGLFDADVRVHVLGEVGFDSRSRTEFMTIALVQVERTVSLPCPPLLPACERVTTMRDETTWANVAGDPQGTIGPVSSVGLAWSLETYG